MTTLLILAIVFISFKMLVSFVAIAARSPKEAIIDLILISADIVILVALSKALYYV